MDFTAQYCATRRSLEEETWVLTSKLSNTATRLMGTVGVNHKLFNETTVECGEIRAQLAALHRQLKEHRSGHGC
jgi:hypothetical protein